MLILLTHANHLFSDPKQVSKMQPYPPLQTLIAAAVLREAGFEVALFDTTFNRDIAPAIAELKPAVVAVCEDNFNFLTKMCLLENRRFACEIAEFAAAHGARAIINSSDATDHPDFYLNAGFDTVILGELEATLAPVCSGAPAVPGTAWTADGVVRFGAIRAPIADLDSVPAAAWDLLDVTPYRSAWMREHGCFTLNLVASRGCPYRCNWCAKPLYGSSYRHHSARRCAADLLRLKTMFAPDRVWFADDIFGLSARWTIEFASQVETLGAGVPFRIQSRCDLMTRDTVDALASAGCYEVWMGVESGSQHVLDSMEKGIRVEHVHLARENLRRHGIRACYFLQFGYPGETWADVESTIALVRQTRPDDIGVSVSYPLPNTRFHQIVNLGMREKSNWSHSGDLNLMYGSALPSSVYRALADALHLEVRSPGSDARIRSAWEEVEHLRCVSC